MKKRRLRTRKQIPFLTSILAILFTMGILFPQSLYAEESIYGVGSVSKMYGTAAIMRLSEQGRVDLDAPVTTYLPEFRMADERYKTITVRMLLNHSSGLIGTTYHDCFLMGDQDSDYHDTFLMELQSQTLKADPGEYSIYCNDGFTLVELIVERVSGMSFESYINQEFLNPMGITNTFIHPNEEQRKSIVETYFDGRKLPRENIQSRASGGLFSTPEDVCRFSQIFIPGTNHALTKASLDAMNEREYLKAKICNQDGYCLFGYGLGWDNVNNTPTAVEETPMLQKGGDSGGYHTGLTVLPEQRLTVCVAATGGNCSSYHCQMMATEIVNEVLREEGLLDENHTETYAELEAKAMLAKENPIKIPEELKQYNGFYQGNSIWKIEMQENELTLTSQEKEDDIQQTYLYLGDGKFLSTDGSFISHDGTPSTTSAGVSGATEFYFSKESNGKTYMMGTVAEKDAGVGEVASVMTMAEKIESKKLNDDIKNAWKKRDESKYYLIGETYNSRYYLEAPYTKVDLLPKVEGYIAATERYKNCQIIDENKAVCELDLPIMLGRDLPEYQFYQDNNTEYLHLGTMTYIAENAIAPFEQGKNRVVLKENGQWYQLNEKDSVVRIKITCPENGAYYVYDKNDTCISSSMFEDDSIEITMPEEGKILFTGSVGSEFQISP